ncbi:hypothetical protein [Serpentinicella alkaliphila]|uniref:Uncharacterized protein n=1 Tax=Serpentinicella alkaliphila TaxID=1734049 RepID=A0A4R2TQS6_9FIRM|nr:hypothetical protein [Serpentinicella alkaliphila]QUH25815.1 hypothetical protein HZR23_08745 [Serpentinicella alkaliphila]TCP99828.1 hypothetical protein EDD79_103216 [Serpentinicella alkaliphila]
MCVASCSGQAIFLIDNDREDGYSYVTIPYEFLPLPEVTSKGQALDRSGTVVCEAKVIEIKSIKAYDLPHLVTFRVPEEMGTSTRFFRQLKEVH